MAVRLRWSKIFGTAVPKTVDTQKNFIAGNVFK